MLISSKVVNVKLTIEPLHALEMCLYLLRLPESDLVLKKFPVKSMVYGPCSMGYGICV